jgi:hypothetical protein
MPTTDPLFIAMVSKVAGGDLPGAAAIAANSKYFANYLARRLAFQMQNPSLDASVVTDSDATAYLIAHFVGAQGVAPSISTIWSENATYLVNTATSGSEMPTHAASLSATQLADMDWSSMLMQTPGQTAQNADGSGAIAIPVKHVGGYITLSDRPGDNSFAMFGATLGTNLRMIEGIWEISTGLTLADVESTAAVAADAPRFVPEDNVNFFHGQGQAACLSCHGGGMSSLYHGYSTVADVFDFGSKGLTFNSNPTTATMKSLGSNQALRAVNASCNLVQNPTAVCNPDSAGIDANQGWDVGMVWGVSGVLSTMGWTGPTSGQGLNQLGAAIGQATAVYQFLTTRIINEICPMGEFTAAQVASIAALANPYASPAGTNDVRTIVTNVATNASCQ